MNGEGVQRRGIVPDVDFEAITGGSHGGEGDLENALPWARGEGGGEMAGGPPERGGGGGRPRVEPRTGAGGGSRSGS